MSQEKPGNLIIRRRLLYLSALVMDTCLGVVLFAIPLLLVEKLHASVFIVGLAGSLGGLGYSFLCLGTGRLSDRLGRKKIAVAGIIGFIFMYILITHAVDILYVGILVILGGASMSLFWPPLQAWIAESTERKDLTKTLGIFNVAWSTGIMLGPLLGGFLFPIDYRLPFYFACGLAVVLVFLILSLSDKKIEDVSDTQEKMSLGNATDKTGFLLMAWIANFTSWFIMAMTRNIFPVLALSLNINPRILGFVLFLLGFSQTVMFMGLRQGRRWCYRLEPLLLAQLLSVAGLTICFFTSSVVFFGLSFIFMGISAGMSNFSSIFYSLDSYINRGRKTGFHESILGAGVMIGPLLGGIAARYYGLRAPYLLGVVLLACAIVLQVIIYSRTLNGKTKTTAGLE